MIKDEDDAQGRVALWILVGAIVGACALGALLWMASVELAHLLAEWLL